jgi:integrase
MKLSRKDDNCTIKTLYEKSGDSVKIKEPYEKYDLPIKAIDSEHIKNFKAYLSNRYSSRNSVGIVLRSLQAIINDAGESFDELRNHQPFRKIKKGSYKNAPNPLTTAEINALRESPVAPGSSEFHVKNYFLFMFGNMGMNFYDMALIKRFQFDGERIKYFRKKTLYEGDYFSVKQNKECLEILNCYINDQKPKEYIFPILANDLPVSKLHKVKNDRLGWFNKHIRALAEKVGIDKDVTSYSPRDTWTNIGLTMGIDIRKISAGLGHSSIEVTNKHYSASIQEKILDEINTTITA